MKYILIALTTFAGLPSFAEIKSMEPTDRTTVLMVDQSIKVQVIRYEDEGKRNTCYVMLPSGKYTQGQGSANPISAVSGISCVKN